MKEHKVTASIAKQLKEVKNFDFLINNFQNTIDKRINNDVFSAMIFIIVGQQINNKVAINIRNKLISSKSVLDPTKFLNLTVDDLSLFGITKQRANYCFNFANWFVENKELSNYNFLKSLSFTDLLKLLTKIKGIGPWTVKIFSMMCLGNKNMTSFEDLAIRKGLEWLWDSEDIKKDFDTFIKEGSPNLTIASFLLNKITEFNLFIYPSYKDYHDYYYDVVSFFNKTYYIKATNYELVSIFEKKENLKIKRNEITKETINWLKQYQKGEQVKFKHKVRLPYSEKSRRVYNSLMNVKFGNVISYLELANLSNMNKASRRVGTLMKENKVPFIIPCHRVIKSSGEIGNYLMGLKTKEILLKHEVKNEKII